MSASNRKGPGRPKKKKPVPYSEYKGVVGEPSSSDKIMEVILTEPFLLLQYLMTLKSNNTTSLKIFITPERLIIKAAIEFKPTTHKSSQDTNGKSMYIVLEGANVFSYYCSSIIVMEITSMNALNDMIEYLDQYSESISLFIRSGVSNNLNYKIYNSLLRVHINSHIESSIVYPGNNFNCSEYMIGSDFDFSSANVIFKQCVAEHFKKLLVKKSTKKATSFRLTAKVNNVEIEVVTDKKIRHLLSFDLEGNESIVNMKPSELYSVHFPKQDVFNFIIHIKTKIDIHMNHEYVLMSHEECGMKLYSLVKIDL